MPDQSVTWPTILTAVVALYGAGLSTYNAFSTYIKNRRHLIIKLSFGLTSPSTQKSLKAIFVKVANPSEKNITINSIVLVMPDCNQALLPHLPGSTTLPHDLAPGKDCVIFADAENFAHDLFENGYRGTIKIKAKCFEATGKEYLSNRLKYDIEGWIKMSNNGIQADVAEPRR